MATVRYAVIALFVFLTLTEAAVLKRAFASKPGASGSEITRKRIVLENGTKIPHGFEAFETSIRASLPGTLKEVVNGGNSCEDVREPDVPTEVPDWAKDTIETLREIDDVEEVAEGAFVNGGEIVIKYCTYETLAEVVNYIRPSGKVPDPHWDIFMDCGPGSYTIVVEETLVFGHGWPALSGYTRLIVPNENLILDGDSKRRIMMVQPKAELLVSGVTFSRGKLESAINARELVDTKWSGAAVHIQFDGAFTAHLCTFSDNHSAAYFARSGSGGALKAEPRSFAMLWGCKFLNNSAGTGGAIAASSAHVLFVRNCSFIGNIAFGGMDGAQANKGTVKNNLLARGGAIRVDSVSTQTTYKQHVLICHSEFKQNQIEFTEQTMRDKFGYTVDDMKHLKVSGAAITLFNADGRIALDFTKSFATIDGCLFEENESRTMPDNKLGMYVLEVQGAGHCTIQNSVFIKNKVKKAVSKINNSSRLSSSGAFETTLSKLKFVDNEGVFNLEFEAGRQHSSNCKITDVTHMSDGTGSCQTLMIEAVKAGGNDSEVGGGVFDGIGIIDR